MKRILIGVALWGMVGCGSGSGDGNTGGTTGSQPTTHLLDQQSLSVPAGQAIAVGPYSVPGGATITYQITDTPTGIGSDTMTVGIATQATAEATNPTLFAAQSNVSSTSGTTPDLTAGAYDLYVACQNFSDPCIFEQTVTAFY